LKEVAVPRTPAFIYVMFTERLSSSRGEYTVDSSLILPEGCEDKFLP